ncbi:acetolactate synthase AlsS [Spiroplasma sp. AdecLV25b]|uniref:acetolactate synthase AlsS n=1 Tax=Spiroplasma sp. AdecLV25b TaxID=3027162 RepID=UPI0027E06637|nr:acetolactate synthase AlsS [Spiroplasma sp. AdecLV25b]
MKKDFIKTGADLVVDTLINQGVKYIFGIPGAKIDKVFDVLNDRGPQLIVARHEQNAAFMATAIGRITGKAGVVLVTSGPGASNLATGLVTANAEGDPIVAIAGNVQRQDRLKRTHQSMNNAALFAPITKFSKEVIHQDNISETITNAFRSAENGIPGASFVSLPADIITSPVAVQAVAAVTNEPKLGIPTNKTIKALINKINAAKLPVFLLGMRASSTSVTTEIGNILRNHSFPVVETFQAAGIITRELESNFYGRLGLFKNQPGDDLLNAADLIITIGYDPIEYYPRIWNKNLTPVINIDEVISDIDNFYQPVLEIIGNISLTLKTFNEQFKGLKLSKEKLLFLNKLQAKLSDNQQITFKKDAKVHPLFLINTLRSIIDDSVTVTCDVGSHYIWMARYFRSYKPRTLLFSNGMQTLGVALPWAIGAALVRPNQRVVSMSGDGGFLFSAMELETAVRLKLPIVHLIWNDGTYDMVAFQQIMKYKRTSGVDLGPVDFVKYAESFGAIGLRVERQEQLADVLKQALNYQTPVIIDVIIDYSDNINLGQTMLENQIY